MKKNRLAALASCALLAPVISQAGSIDYNAFAGTTINFDGLAGSPNLGMGEVLGDQYAALGVTFSVPNYAAYASTSVAQLAMQNSDPNMVWVDQGGGGNDNAQGITINFASAQSEVGLFLWGSRTSTFTLEVYDGNTLLESVTSPFTDDTSVQYPEGFLALSNDNITRAVVFSTSHFDAIPGFSGTNWNFSFDDLKFGVHSVPEPGTLPLLLLGIVAAMFFRRRRATA